jgi:signal transduction histidine kinase
VGRERELHPASKTALFRIVQEALTNVVKHAAARHATIRLSYRAESVAVRVEDDGVGFDTGSIGNTGRTSWGLKNMEERAALLGGLFSIHSSPDQGTTVEVSLPDSGSDGGVG